jgi:hypothetical protein
MFDKKFAMMCVYFGSCNKPNSLSLSLSKLNKKDFAVLWVLSVINIFIFFLLVGSEGH